MAVPSPVLASPSSSLSLARGPPQHAALQSAVPAGELPDEVLFLPRSVVAAALVRSRGREWKSCGIRSGQNVGPDREHVARYASLAAPHSREEDPDDAPHGHITSLVSRLKVHVPQVLLPLSSHRLSGGLTGDWDWHRSSWTK